MVALHLAAVASIASNSSSNGTAVGTWLKIDVLASGDLGLAHTFYFGNLAGDMTGTGGIPDWLVDQADLDLVRANWGATPSECRRGNKAIAAETRPLIAATSTSSAPIGEPPWKMISPRRLD